MVLFSPSELLVLLKTEQLFKVGSISYLPRVQSEFPSGKSYTLICVCSGGWEGERGKGAEKGERLRSGDTGKERVYCNSAQELSKKAKFLDHMGSFLGH